MSFISNFRKPKKPLPSKDEGAVNAIRTGRKKREFVVIGLGRFGSSVAQTLVRYGHDVLAIDSDAGRVQHLSRELPNVVQLDATNAEALEQIGVGQFEIGLVCISNDFESNLLATVLLRRMGVQRVITKAGTRLQKTILEEVGAHEVILPEHEAGIHLGRRLANRLFVDYLEIREGLSVVEIKAPDNLWGNTLAECNLRQKMGLNIIAIYRNEEIIANPRADFRIEENDTLLVLGRMEDAERMQQE